MGGARIEAPIYFIQRNGITSSVMTGISTLQSTSNLAKVKHVTLLDLFTHSTCSCLM